MADDKKFDKKPGLAPAARSWHPLEVVVILFVLVSVVGAIFNSLANLFSSGDATFFGFSLSGIKDFFFGNSIIFKFISISISVFAAAAIVVLSQLRGQILIAEKAKLFPMGLGETSDFAPEDTDEIKLRWQKILENTESDSESNWRIAIIEADIILDELLQKLSLPGDTMGDKLKAIEGSDFLTLNEAWEAHKVRNEIAHGGAGFLLNQRETRRVISLYEKVFKEFYLI